jgi:hypothetical protein
MILAGKKGPAWDDARDSCAPPGPHRMGTLRDAQRLSQSTKHLGASRCPRAQIEDQHDVVEQVRHVGALRSDRELPGSHAP